MKKLFVYILAVMIVLPLTLPLVLAHCPLCTGAAVAGVGVARFYGVDDGIVGLFLGAFIVSTGLWVDRWLKKKKKSYPFQAFILVLLSFLLLVIPLYIAGVITSFEMVKSMPQYSMLGMGIYGLDK